MWPFVCYKSYNSDTVWFVCALVASVGVFIASSYQRSASMGYASTNYLYDNSYIVIKTPE